MSRIVRSDFENPDLVVSILEKSLHGGFVPESELTDGQQRVCERVEWIQHAVKFRCDCSRWHVANEDTGDYRCPMQMHPVEPDEFKEGFRTTSELSLDIDTALDHQLEIEESASTVDISRFEDKSIIFLPDVESLEFPDKVGQVVWLPLQRLPDIFDDERREVLVSEIQDKRKNIIDWGRLDNQGNDFEEITYRLVSRKNIFENTSWGGRGPDQGKDGFCSIDLSGRMTRILIQAKFNPSSSGVNGDAIQKYIRHATEHDCSGLLLTTIHITGQAESAYESHGFRTQTVNYVRLWSGVEMKEELANHPDLIAEYFLH